jgi:hypothetical protein
MRGTAGMPGKPGRDFAGRRGRVYCFRQIRKMPQNGCAVFIEIDTFQRRSLVKKSTRTVAAIGGRVDCGDLFLDQPIQIQNVSGNHDVSNQRGELSRVQQLIDCPNDKCRGEK